MPALKSVAECDAEILDCSTRLDAQRQERARCTTSGKHFDERLLHRLETRLDRLREARPLLAEKERQATASAAADRREQHQQALERAEEQRLAAIGVAEKAAREFARALDVVKATTTTMNECLAAAGREIEPPMLPTAVETRVWQMLLGALAEVRPTRVVGGFSFGAHQILSGAWIDAERAIGRGHVAPRDAKPAQPLRIVPAVLEVPDRPTVDTATHWAHRDAMQRDARDADNSPRPRRGLSRRV